MKLTQFKKAEFFKNEKKVMSYIKFAKKSTPSAINYDCGKSYNNNFRFILYLLEAKNVYKFKIAINSVLPNCVLIPLNYKKTKTIIKNSNLFL